MREKKKSSYRSQHNDKQDHNEQTDYDQSILFLRSSCKNNSQILVSLSILDKENNNKATGSI